MSANDTLNTIMNRWRISNVLLSQMTGIHVTTLCRYRKNQRNISGKGYMKIYNALKKLDVNNTILEELNQIYENSRYKKIS